MKHVLIFTPTFKRAARRITKKSLWLADDIAETLRLLETDPRQPALRTHKLTGDLDQFWACSAGYDLRIMFQYGRHKDRLAVVLETVGTHNEIY